MESATVSAPHGTIPTQGYRVEMMAWRCCHARGRVVSRAARRPGRLCGRGCLFRDLGFFDDLPDPPRSGCIKTQHDRLLGTAGPPDRPGPHGVGRGHVGCGLVPVFARGLRSAGPGGPWHRGWYCRTFTTDGRTITSMQVRKRFPCFTLGHWRSGFANAARMPIMQAGRCGAVPPPRPPLRCWF